VTRKMGIGSGTRSLKSKSSYGGTYSRPEFWVMDFHGICIYGLSSSGDCDFLELRLVKLVKAVTIALNLVAPPT
jgi:hypothetical protein